MKLLTKGWQDRAERFLEMFDSRQIGDSDAFFKWYAYAKAKNDWQKTKLCLKELLNSSERVDAY